MVCRAAVGCFKEELEGHGDADAADVVKLETVGEAGPSARRGA